MRASLKTLANSKVRSLGVDDKGPQDSRAKNGSKLPQMAASKICPDRLDTKARDIKRKVRSFSGFRRKPEYLKFHVCKIFLRRLVKVKGVSIDGVDVSYPEGEGRL